MQFEKFDDKVKQAAEQHHPNYDEMAWTKMEKLLDRHLPQENDRKRRIIFFILLFLLVGGGIFTIYKTRQPENTATAYKNATPAKTTADPSLGSNKEVTEQPTSAADIAKSSTNASQQDLVKQPVTTSPSATGDNKLNSSIPVIIKPVGQSKQASVKNQSQQDAYQVDVEPGTKSGKVSLAKTNGDPVNSPTTDNNSVVNTTNTLKGNDAGDKAAPQTLNTNSAVSVVNNDNKTNPDAKSTQASTATVKDETVQPPVPAVEKNVTKKSPGQKRNGFFLSASAGPDVSSVGMDKPGKAKILGGAGFGYSFGRWSVRTGFYTARKVYTADKESYKPGGGVVIPNYPYLDRINADCRVYEIPLSVAYNFSESKKANWFASTGLSSYIMKKEDYQYVYDYPNMTQPVVYEKTISNENKHYFSVLDLSVGYQRKINKTLSVSAEPYIKIPLAGIGFGNVKLNSAGVLVSINVNLFQPASVK
jgi:hypothetical protein